VKKKLWHDRIAALIRTYQTKVQPAEFRAGFRNALVEGRKTGNITEHTESAWTDLRQRFESIEAPSGLEADIHALSDSLLKIDTSQRHLIANAIFFNLARRFSNSWNPVGALTSIPDASITLALAKNSRRSELVKAARIAPGRFFDSVLLDHVINLKITLPPDIWVLLAENRNRSSDLLPSPLIAVKAYSVDRNPRTRKKFMEVLRKGGPRVVGALLQEPPVATRFLIESFADLYQASAKTRKETTGALKDVIAAMMDGGSVSPTQRQHYPLLSIARCLASDTDHAEIKAVLDGALVEEVVRQALARSLREAETGQFRDNTLIVATKQELYSAFHEHLSRLNFADGAKGRAEAYHKYQGRREVIEPLLLVLQRSESSLRLKEELEAVLFNSGVREVEEVGAVVPFDGLRHEATESGVLRGDSVRVGSAGYALGMGADAIILQRARVAPFVQEGAR
jgi:hypothetical protein